MNELSGAIRRIAGTGDVQFRLCTVDSVDQDSLTCKCTSVSGSADTQYEDVELMASVDDGVLYIPTIGSNVIIAYSSIIEPFVLMVSAVDEIFLVSGNSAIDVTSNLIKMNDGAFAGLVKVIPLVQKLNNLENKVNSIISTFNAHTHTGVQTGGGTSGTPVLGITGTLTPTTRGDVENTNITHGASI